MLTLFKAEFIRYRFWAILAFILQLFTLSFFAKLGPVLEPLNHELTLLIIVVSFAFGFVQMTLHKRKNHWVFLLQRPLKSSKIYLALATAGMMNVLIAVPIAWLIIVIGFDYFTDTIIDMRHYYFSLFLAAIGILTYLMGSLTALNASRAAILTGIGLFVAFQSVSQYILLQSSMAILIIFYLLHLNIASFKPDLSQPLTSRLSTIMLVVPMQMMIVLLLVLSTQLFYHLPKFMLASSPSELVVEGTIDFWRELPAEERGSFLLKNSDVDNKELLARQTELATSEVINIYSRSFGKKGQYPFRDKNFSMIDKVNNNLWVFSHDDMLLQGINNKTGKVVGWVGKTGFFENIATTTTKDRFNSIPFMLKDQFLITKNTIFMVDFEAKELSIKVSIPNGEQMIGLPQFTEGFFSMITHKHIYIFDNTDIFEKNGPVPPAYSLSHPTTLSQMATIDTYAMVDGLLLIYAGNNYRGFDKPGAEIIYAKRDGGEQTLYKMFFEKQNYPKLIRHFEYVVSPLLYTWDATMSHALRAYPDEEHPITNVFSGVMPTYLNVVTLILHLLSIGIVIWVSRLINLNTKKTTLWFVMTGLIGIPALVSFFFVNKVKGNIFPKSVLTQSPDEARLDSTSR